jgi:hypothetical protein
MPNTCYVLNIIGERAIQITGKPYMVVKYNNITQEILDVEFGLSEAIVGANTTDWPAEAGTALHSEVSNMENYEILGLKPLVYELVGFDDPVPGGKYKSIIQGVQQISFVYDVESGSAEQWTFTYTSGTMTGGVTNLDTYYYGGNDSDTNAFKLRRIQ